MCGIAGIFSPSSRSDRPLSEIADKMGRAIQHRGPDDHGVWSDDEAGISLAHRRLSILDLSTAGHQPMISRSGRHVIAFNGECYNFGELRTQLENEGLEFKSRTDTEVLLEACEHWGVETTLCRTNGMFAFALWDRERRLLTLARDRLGIKPLYYGVWQGGLLFGSELKALKQYPGFSPEVDPDALGLYLQYKYIRAPHTIFKGISKLPPAHFVVLSADSLRNKPKQYWNLHDYCPPNVPFFDGSEIECIHEIERLLSRSLDYRQIADVPLGAFLSGGIDSSLIVSLMQERSTSKIKTFTIGFDERAYDESEAATAIAKHLGTDHTVLQANAQTALELVPEMPSIYDEPFADTSQIPTYLLSKLTKKHVTVCLSGDGGDEFFTGYNGYFLSAPRLRRLSSIPRVARHLGAAALASIPSRLYDARTALAKANKYATVLKADNAHRRFAAMTSEFHDFRRYVSLDSKPETGFDHERMAAYEESPYTSMMVHDALSYIPEDVLTKVDRASMAVALEARVPLLDHRLVEFAASIPPSLKIKDSKSKYLLRQIVEKRIPPRLLDRPKRGFSMPVSQWLRSELKPWAEELLSQSSLEKHGLLNGELVRKRWKEHCSGRSDFAQNLWSILMFQAWSQRWL